MRVTEVRAAYPKWRRLPPAAAWQAHFWQIAVRVVTDVGVVVVDRTMDPQGRRITEPRK